MKTILALDLGKFKTVSCLLTEDHSSITTMNCGPFGGNHLARLKFFEIGRYLHFACASSREKVQTVGNGRITQALGTRESVLRRSRISLFSGLCGLNERAYFFLRN
jgi:hypothetical protein